MQRAVRYIFSELLPPFFMGLVVFIFILLMIQVLRWTEFVLIHGVSLTAIAQIISYLAISFLPSLFPMALLFAIIMTYTRLSQDSEVVAFRSLGLGMQALLIPALILSTVVACFSLYTFFRLGPWGNRQFEILISELSQSKAGATIREGTFSEGFFDLVVYASKVDSKSGQLEKVFIFDESSGDLPLTVISKKGQMIQDPQKRSVTLRLADGDIHRKGETHTKIKFETFDIKLFDPSIIEEREKSPQSLTLDEILAQLRNPKLSADKIRNVNTEFHKRLAISFACLIFAVLGVALATQANRREQKASGIVLCLIVIIVYWVFYVSFEGLARSGQLPVALAVWTPNILFSVFAFRSLKKIWT